MEQWSEEEIVNLIEEYRRHPMLWNPKHKDYKKRNLKKDAFGNIAQVLLKTTDEIERKISVVLAQYRRARQKVEKMKKSGMGTDEIDTEIWFGYKYLAFLNDRYTPNETRQTSRESQQPSGSGKKSEIPDVVSSDNSIEDNVPDDHNEPYEELHDTTTEPIMQTENAENISDAIEINKKRKLMRNQNPMKRKIATESDTQTVQAFNMLTSICEKKNEPKDACSTYGNHIASKLRGFDPLTRLNVERKINNIIYEAEMNMLYTQCNPERPLSAVSNASFSTNTNSYVASPQMSVCSTPMPSPQENAEFNINEFLVPKTYQTLH